MTGNWPVTLIISRSILKCVLQEVVGPSNLLIPSPKQIKYWPHSPSTQAAARGVARPCVRRTPLCLARTLRMLHRSTRKIINDGNRTPLRFVSTWSFCVSHQFTSTSTNNALPRNTLYFHSWGMQLLGKRPAKPTGWSGNHPRWPYLSLLVLLLLLMESLLEDLLLDPLPLGERVGLDAWLASLCGDCVLDCDECGDRLLLCW